MSWARHGGDVFNSSAGVVEGWGWGTQRHADLCELQDSPSYIVSPHLHLKKKKGPGFHLLQKWMAGIEGTEEVRGSEAAQSKQCQIYLLFKWNTLQNAQHFYFT